MPQTTYYFTATITKRPFANTMKGSVKVIGSSLDALQVVAKIIEEKTDISDPRSSIKVSIRPSVKKS